MSLKRPLVNSGNKQKEIANGDYIRPQNLGSGTPDSTKSLRGDNTWAAVTKAEIGLENVDNTSDVNKPVSIAQAAAISTAINNLINGAPGALDALNELAAAMGNDANFSTTVTNALAAKEPTITGTSQTTDFWSGAKTFRNLATDVRAIVLSGLSLATNAAITSGDSILSGLGKLQKQITDLSTSLSTTAAALIAVDATKADLVTGKVPSTQLTDATDSVKGIMKLYNDLTANNIDGGITQNIFKAAIESVIADINTEGEIRAASDLILNDINDVGEPIAYTDIDITGIPANLGSPSTYARYRFTSSNSTEYVDTIANVPIDLPFWVTNGAIEMTVAITPFSGGLFDDCLAGDYLAMLQNYGSLLVMPANSGSRILCKKNTIGAFTVVQVLKMVIVN